MRYILFDGKYILGSIDILAVVGNDDCYIEFVTLIENDVIDIGLHCLNIFCEIWFKSKALPNSLAIFCFIHIYVVMHRRFLYFLQKPSRKLREFLYIFDSLVLYNLGISAARLLSMLYSIFLYHGYIIETWTNLASKSDGQFLPTVMACEMKYVYLVTVNLANFWLVDIFWIRLVLLALWSRLDIILVKFIFA